MYQFDATHVVDAFTRAKNLNSAVKAFLKHQGSKQDPKSVRFAKDLREVVQSGSAERIKGLVTSQFDSHRDTLISVAACAHTELITEIIGKIADTYSEEFNATYSHDGEVIKVIEAKNFEKIAKDAIKQIDSTLKERGWQDTNFLKAVVVNQLFDSPVLVELEHRKLLS